MSIAAAWPQWLAFSGTPLGIEPSADKLSVDAGRLPLRPFNRHMGLSEQKQPDA
jgi:hypothetical protein